jgi:hypothetical protein
VAVRAGGSAVGVEREPGDAAEGREGEVVTRTLLGFPVWVLFLVHGLFVFFWLWTRFLIWADKP